MQGKIREVREAILSLDYEDRKTIGRARDIFKEILNFLDINMKSYEPPLELPACYEDEVSRYLLQYRELELLIEMTEFLYNYDEFVITEEIEK